jgi:hypothetical protein
MKKMLFPLVLAAMLGAACDNFHASDNGKLDGFWQLTAVDTLKNGVTVDVREKRIFWAVQANLLEIRDISGNGINVFFRFSHQGNSLILSDPVADKRIISDSTVTDASTIRRYGISQLRDTLQVLQLTDEKMTLESRLQRMFFRKY